MINGSNIKAACRLFWEAKEITGPSNAKLRQQIVLQLTGCKRPVSQCGANEVYALLIESIVPDIKPRCCWDQVEKALIVRSGRIALDMPNAILARQYAIVGGRIMVSAIDGNGNRTYFDIAKMPHGSIIDGLFNPDLATEIDFDTFLFGDNKPC